ncbi:MAG: SRPBCC domain-containing protein [Mycobacteriales bacterium]
MSATTLSTTQVYRVYIKATAEAIWTAITDPDWTDRYGYTGRAHYELRPGGRYWVNPGAEFRAEAERRGNILADVIIDGEVLEADPPRKLVTTFRMLMDEQMAAEGFSRITHEIKEIPGGVCSLTVTHELENTPTLALLVSGAQEEYGAGGGHAWVLSDIKSLLETGKSFAT